MKITVKSTNLDVTPSLQTYIDSKMSTLVRLVTKFDSEGAVVLRLEVGRTTKHHHKGDVFMAEANLSLPGKILRAVEKSDDIRKAIDLVKRTLHLEVERFKEKTIDSRKRLR